MVETMRLYSERENTDIVGLNLIQNQDDSWRLKKFAILAVLDSLCNLIKEEDKHSFYCLYWALKTYGMICMDFKDL